MPSNLIVTVPVTNSIYYINTNEIPGNLSRENFISSHVKISPLWLQNDSQWRLCQSRHDFRMVFIRIRNTRYEISVVVFKNIYLVRCAHSENIFLTLEDKFRISARPCNILYKFYSLFVLYGRTVVNAVG